MQQSELFPEAPELDCGTDHQRRMESLLRTYSERQIPLSVASDRSHMHRSITTLKRYARKLNLSFPDYTPRKLEASQ